MLVVLIGGCGAREKPQTVNDPSLHGTWHVVVTPEGRKPSEIGVSILWKFDANRISVIDGESGETISQSVYRVETTTTPKRIDMEIDDIEKETRRGVYRIRDGKLHIMLTVGGGSRPENLVEEEAIVFVRGPND